MAHKNTSDTASSKKEKDSRNQDVQELLDAFTVPVWMQGKDRSIMYDNRDFSNRYGESKNKRCFEKIMGKKSTCSCCPYSRIFQNMSPEKCRCTRRGQRCATQVYHFPFQSPDGAFQIMKFEIDLPEEKQTEIKDRSLSGPHPISLDKGKVLGEWLTACASCKKIREENGRWQEIESYIRDHSGTEFSHGICPDCAKDLYPHLF